MNDHCQKLQGLELGFDDFTSHWVMRIRVLIVLSFKPETIIVRRFPLVQALVDSLFELFKLHKCVGVMWWRLCAAQTCGNAIRRFQFA